MDFRSLPSIDLTDSVTEIRMRWPSIADQMPARNRAQRRAKAKAIRRYRGRWSPTNPDGWR